MLIKLLKINIYFPLKIQIIDHKYRTAAKFLRLQIEGDDMAVRFLTSASASLLKKFNDAIDQDEPKGKITTWEKRVHNKVTYYTHKSKEWGKKAYFKVSSDSDRLRFNVVPPQGSRVSQDVYAYYHGHLLETFIRHFSKDFTDGRASPTAQGDDSLVAKKTT